MDKDLNILNHFSRDELMVLVKIMEEKWSNCLSKEAKENPTEHVAEIADEFCAFGGNTIANVMRGFKGVPYREILEDTCNDLRVPYYKGSDTYQIEGNLLNTVLETAWDNMDEEEKSKLLKDLGHGGGIPASIWGIGALQGAKVAGFTPAIGAQVIASAFSKHILGKGIQLAAPLAVVTVIKGFFAWLGPILWAWTLYDVVSPSKKVTIPGCVYIAAMRQIKTLDSARG